MKTITVFTTTYNRDHLLPRLYESLCAQRSDDFLWLIIDDGSTDGTKSLTDLWIKEEKIKIQYCHKKNGGMHTGHNLAFSLIKTEYCVCVDSDDYLLDNSILNILDLLAENKVSKNDDLAGIIGLNITIEGKVIGTKFPKNFLVSTYQNLSNNHGVFGDKKIVYKSEFVKRLDEYPTFYPERFVPLYFPIILDLKYKFLCFNENFCIVEYQNDGSTINIYNQYFKHPKGFRHARGIEMTYLKSYKNKFKSAVHLVSSNIILKERNLTKGAPNRLLAFVAIPAGIIWYFKIKSMINSQRDISKYI